MNTSNKTISVASLSTEGENKIKVRGVLNFETVPALAKDAAKILKNMNEIDVDFLDDHQIQIKDKKDPKKQFSGKFRPT